MINVLPFLRGEMMPDDDYKLALYSTSEPPTLKYRRRDEVVGQGYVQGGKALNSPTYGRLEKGAWVNFTGPVTWVDATISAKSCVIYNDRSKVVVSSTVFDSEISSTNHEFVVDLLPDTDPLIRITYKG